MGMYELSFKKSVKKDLRKIPESVIRLLKVRIEKLEKEPRPLTAKDLRGYQDYYRIRIGNYRVVYHINEEAKVVTIYKIGHRKDIYRSL